MDLSLIEGFDNPNGVTGEVMALQFFSDDFVVKSYSIEGTLPLGLALSPDVNEFGVGGILGTPIREGSWLITLRGWEEEVGNGPSSLPLSIFIQIVSLGPKIEQHPENTVGAWGEELTISVVLNQVEGVSFQWQKIFKTWKEKQMPILSYPMPFAPTRACTG